MKFGWTLCWSLLALPVIVVSGQDLSDPDLQSMLTEYSSEHMTESYRFSYATADGQFREETGMLMNPGTPQEELVVVGMYGYETDDGTQVMVMYVSGKGGYKAKTKFRKLAESERKKKLLSSLIG
ncbi:endocuticle structural glycoprotein SgAbd-2-like [Culex pipiens pallens]|uniref:endocuticle structural glycoprotein SgAbd-2-like n=1 Tax=Culex pipiens pallens TaxID=42434 RepID=UPI001953F241|nr:endocuticle structural glycoprotein SgAbd-2-like [Culex pipiens pallens]